MRQIRPAATLAVALASAGLPAEGAEWRLTGSVAQRFEVLTNPDLEAESEGAAFGSMTSFGVVLGAETGRTVWELGTGVAISAFTGPAASDDLSRPNPNASGRVEYRGQRFTLSGDFSFLRQSTAFSEFDLDALLDAIERGEVREDGSLVIDDDLVTESTTVRTAYALGAGLRYQLSPIDTLGIVARGSVIRYSEDVAGLSPNSSYLSRLSWDRRISDVSTAGLEFAVQRFRADDDEQTRGTTFTATGRYGTSLTRATQMRATLGVGYTETDELAAPGFATRVSDTDISATGSFGVTYQPSAATAVAFGVSHGVRPTTDGDLRSVTAFDATYSHSLTPLARLSIAARHSLETEIDGSGDGGGLEQSLILTPSLTYQLAPEWSAQLGYAFRLADGDDGLATGNRVFLSVSRSLAFFP